MAPPGSREASHEQPVGLGGELVSKVPYTQRPRGEDAGGQLQHYGDRRREVGGHEHLSHHQHLPGDGPARLPRGLPGSRPLRREPVLHGRLRVGAAGVQDTHPREDGGGGGKGGLLLHGRHAFAHSAGHARHNAQVHERPLRRLHRLRGERSHWSPRSRARRPPPPREELPFCVAEVPAKPLVPAAQHREHVLHHHLPGCLLMEHPPGQH
mmetsp:Transcript_46550/g.122938  ORF Transcript_46550/g.122938 Transcript_46550/m.122938 type:complete len:210 (-) Transcript_46550:428-1057(-)